MSDFRIYRFSVSNVVEVRLEECLAWQCTAEPSRSHGVMNPNQEANMPRECAVVPRAGSRYQHAMSPTKRRTRESVFMRCRPHRTARRSGAIEVRGDAAHQVGYALAHRFMRTSSAAECAERDGDAGAGLYWGS